MQKIKGMSEKLQKLFEDALLDAAENQRIIGAQKNTAQSGVKLQLREMGLDEFSKQTKNNIKMRNGVLIETVSELKQHIHLALTTDNKSNLYFGAISDYVKSKIEKEVNASVFQEKQYSFVISNDDIIHISKHFGTNPDVVAKEVLRLYDIVKDYDDVKLEITKQGTKKLIFEKSYSDYDYRSIEIASNKKATLDLVTFYITKNNIKRKGNQSVPPATQNSSLQWGSVSSNNSISNASDSVNIKFQLKESEPDDVTTRAESFFGKTYNWKETGYILTNGSRLDFSGKKDGAPAGQRSMDHREIIDGYSEEMQDELSGSEAMIDFMKRGNIRVSPEMDGINLSVMPTKEQKSTLREFITRARGEIVLDIDNEYGDTEVSVEYQRGTSSAKILNDIRQYFEEGIEPSVSNLSQFRYQLKQKESAYDEAVQEYKGNHSRDSISQMVSVVNEMAELYMPNSKVRNEYGKLMKVYHGTEAGNFNKFDKRRQGQTDSSLWGRGYYFTSEYDFAGMFGDNVRSFFLNITNPFTVSKVDAPAREIADKLIALGEKIDFDYSNLKAHEFANAFGNQKFTNVLASHGYDGVIVGDVRSGDVEYVAFEQNQMKLSDPVTYDDNGNVIPLSERFDDTKTDIRYHKKTEATAEATQKITLNMSEQERYEILKNREIAIAVADSDKIPSDNGLSIKNLKKTDARKLIKTIAKEFNVFGSYDNTDVELSFEFGSNNLDESISKQKSNYDLFVQMLSCFSDVISNAVGIEVHNRNSEGYKVDRTLKQVYVLCSAFANDDYIVPVKLSVKEFVDKPNRLYVAVALEGIKKDRVVNMGVPENGSHIRISPVTISISDIFNNVNENDVDFIKYIPKQFFTDVNELGDGSNKLNVTNGLPRGVLNYQLKSYAIETDSQLLAQHLEENSEAVGEILRRSSDIEMNERTMTRLISKRLRVRCLQFDSKVSIK